jgi:hypothetical protein
LLLQLLLLLVVVVVLSFSPVHPCTESRFPLGCWWRWSSLLLFLLLLLQLQGLPEEARDCVLLRVVQEARVPHARKDAAPTPPQQLLLPCLALAERVPLRFDDPHWSILLQPNATIILLPSSSQP